MNIYTKKKKINNHAAQLNSRYHLGTIAFGSLLLAICKIIRVLIEYIETKAKMYDNIVTRFIITLFKCFFWCLEKFLKFFNTNAYIVCAIKGTGTNKTTDLNFEKLNSNFFF
jgi:solute carrier family 44 (choline transporter-like protein), member 2/4/5